MGGAPLFSALVLICTFASIQARLGSTGPQRTIGRRPSPPVTGALKIDERERDRQRDTERHRERQRETERDRERQRETERERERQRERQRETERDRERQRETQRETERDRD